MPLPTRRECQDDATFAAIQASGGGVATQVQDVLQRFATQSALEPSIVSVGDGYAWFMDKTDNQATPSDDFSPLAARQLVSHLISSPVEYPYYL